MARKKQDTLVLFPEVFYSTAKMSDAQFGVLMRAVFAYRFAREIYDGDDLAVDIAFRTVMSQIDRYIEVCEINRGNAGSKDGCDSEVETSEEQRNATETNEEQGNAPHTLTHIHTRTHIHDSIDVKADKPPTRPRFSPPTVDEVRSYCAEKGYAMDADRFVDYYTSNGWKVGKNPMKDWKAAVRTWNRKEQPNGKAESQPLWAVGTTV